MLDFTQISDRNLSVYEDGESKTPWTQHKWVHGVGAAVATRTLSPIGEAVPYP